MTGGSEHSHPQPRNPRACEACRTSKTRCLTSEEDNICQRCLKITVPCVVNNAPRTRRPRRTNLQMARDRLAVAPLKAVEETPDFSISLPETSLEDQEKDLASFYHHHDIMLRRLMPSPALEGSLHSSDPVTYPNPGVASIPFTPPSEQPVILSKRELTFDEAKELLPSCQIFHEFFPFVVYSPDSTVSSMARGSPFVLLAVLTVVPDTDLKIQHQLDHEFRRVLSEKVVLKGERSLDFLQGLLVYLAWYPHHLKPTIQQTYMYLTLAVSIAVDLGLDQQQPNLESFPRNIDTTGLFDGDSFSKAAQRAYIGCYYVSISLAMTISKPTVIEYSEVIEYYANCLAQDPQFPTDHSVLPMLRSQRINECMHAALKPPRWGDTLGSTHFLPESHLLAFQAEAHTWKTNIPDEVRNSVPVGLAERFMQVSINTFNLGNLTTSTIQRQKWCYPIHGLAAGLDACKKYFEHLLYLPVLTYRGFTGVEWGTIVKSIVILSKLSFPIQLCPEWDFRAAREHAPLLMYLDSLCYRLQCASATVAGPENPKNLDGPYLFKVILDKVRETLEKRFAQNPIPHSTFTPMPFTMASGTPGNASVTSDDYSSTSISSSCTAKSKYCPMSDPDVLSFLDSWAPVNSPLDELYQSRNSDVSKTNSVPVYHDMWATMTMSWANTDT